MADPDEYAMQARFYYESALAADDKIGILPGFELAAPFPVMLLVAHSIELSLKAALLNFGETDIKSFGHDLVKAYKTCLEYGVDENNQLDESSMHILDIISDMHKNMTLRYGEPSKLGRIPVFGPLQSVAQACLRIAGAPTLGEFYAEPEGNLND